MLGMRWRYFPGQIALPEVLKDWALLSAAMKRQPVGTVKTQDRSSDNTSCVTK